MRDDMKHMRPESLMMSYGYEPSWSEGAIKCPIFQTSTFVFKTAEEGKRFFEVAYGIREQEPEEKMGLIYSRLNNPDLEILENRLTLWDGADQACVFESGMSAISTMLLAHLSPGDVILHSNPLYGGTDHFINNVLTKFGVKTLCFNPWDDEQTIIELAQKEAGNKLKMIYLETPANPTNTLIDIEMCSNVAKKMSSEEQKVLLAVDNTYMGPVWQHPMKHGADLVLYSATKYIGGHSDVIAGACLGSDEAMIPVRTLRTFLGSMAGPWTGWLLMRSLETLKVRMDQQARNAAKVADFLVNHPKVEKVYYPGLLTEADGREFEVFKKQCSSGGAMIAFDVVGGEKEAFTFLNSLKLAHLAVSLGSTESLAEHPATMTHADVDADLKQQMGITEKLVRFSVGVEHYEDLISDIGQALDQING
ncbi:MAG: cystathionine gamma-synthase family protein [Flavobacteriales bacterium]|nr:cystathionine gamma-synthase family protein [Flavobacteriales bacterium]MDG1780990.1 cystathionine gamma-synthase family protein [Flavobacteriales bacterium]MDG2246976.1 cystathionine gamma-synthase family protein [Flavobacteriales bacterium]